MFILPGADATKPATSIKASSIQDGATREIAESIVANAQQTIKAQICLIASEPDKPNPNGLFAPMMETPVCKLRGAPNEKDRAQSKYIGMFFDPKLTREANHRPQLRMPPLRLDNYKSLIELARDRFGTEVGDEILVGDWYFVLDGGKSGNNVELLKPFVSKAVTLRSFTLWRNKDSMTQRLARVEGGIGTYRQGGALRIVSASPPALTPTKLSELQG